MIRRYGTATVQPSEHRSLKSCVQQHAGMQASMLQLVRPPSLSQ